MIPPFESMANTTSFLGTVCILPTYTPAPPCPEPSQNTLGNALLQELQFLQCKDNTFRRIQKENEGSPSLPQQILKQEGRFHLQ